MPIERRRLLGVLGTLGAASLGGCATGGTDDDEAGGTRSPTDGDGETTTGAAGTTADDATDTGGGTATPTGAQSAFPDYNWAALDGVDPVATDGITMSGFTFDPLVATMPPGTTVTVSNEDGAGHTVTVPALGIDARVPDGGSTTFTVDRAGTFDYVCEFHPPDMVGRFVVAEDATTASDATATEVPNGTTTDAPTGTTTATPTETLTGTATGTPTETATTTPTDGDPPGGDDY